MDEFSLIKLITTTLGAREGARHDLICGVGDDAAVLDIPDGNQLVVSTDTLTEGVHFEAGIAPEDIGYKALAVNLSDLAAMGARPRWFFLALTLPDLDADWTRAFATGLNEVAEKARIEIAGGDTTHGPLSISITVCGLVHSGDALLRSGARAGDVIGVSGATGLAGLALHDRQQGRRPAPACQLALDRPEPRIGLGQALVGLASGCIDISDGLLADLNHIATASGVGMKINLQDLPCPPELTELAAEDRWNLQLGGGDDYELCFTLAPSDWDIVCQRANALGVTVTRIGEVVAGAGCECFQPDGSVFVPQRSGYNHG